VIARDALGLGLRVAHYEDLLKSLPPLGFLEIISENFMGSAAPPEEILVALSAHYPIVLHGVGLNLLGHEPLDPTYLEALRRLADRLDAEWVSDHLCWTGAHNRRHHDLLPTPFTKDLIGYAAERAAFVQKHLDRPFALENLSSYTTFPQSEMTEWEFYRRVVESADISYLLDLNNIFVSSQNHGFDPQLYLSAIDFSKVRELHLAGHEVQADGLRIDTHDQAVAEDVWQLYRQTWQQGGPIPTLLEWDDKIPSLETTLAELEKARRYQV
jgi:uncharacterized protein (UPF0276 family)